MYVLCDRVDRLVSADLLSESKPGLDDVATDYFSCCGLAEELYLCESGWSKPDYEHVVILPDIGSAYCSDAARGRLYHGAFLKGEFWRQGDHGSSCHVVFGDAEVFGEAAWVNVGLF